LLSLILFARAGSLPIFPRPLIFQKRPIMLFSFYS
jgi:hypothetical protein